MDKGVHRFTSSAKTRRQARRDTSRSAAPRPRKFAFTRNRSASFRFEQTARRTVHARLAGVGREFRSMTCILLVMDSSRFTFRSANKSTGEALCNQSRQPTPPALSAWRLARLTPRFSGVWKPPRVHQPFQRFCLGATPARIVPPAISARL